MGTLTGGGVIYIYIFTKIVVLENGHLNTWNVVRYILPELFFPYIFDNLNSDSRGVEEALKRYRRFDSLGSVS